MGSIVKSIGKAIGKIGKSIGKLVKKALPIVLMAGVAYMGISAYGAMGSGLTGASTFTPTMFSKGMGDITGKVGNFVGGLFGGSPAMASTTGMAGGMASGTAPSGFALQSLTGGGVGMSPATSQTAMFNPATANAGIGMFSGKASAYANTLGGATGNAAIADAMKYQSDMMMKGNWLKAGGSFLTAMFDRTDELKEEDQRITEEEFKRRHTYGGFGPDSGKPSDYAKRGQPGHDPTGFWSQMGGPPQFGYPSGNKGGPRQFQQTALKTPGVNQPGLINSRQGQRQAGLLGQTPKSFV